MSNKGKDSATPPFTMNSNTTGGTFSLGTAPAGQGDLSTTSTPAPASTAAVTVRITFCVDNQHFRLKLGT